MKRIFYIIVLVAIISNSLVAAINDNSLELTQLYIVGDATPTSWDLGRAESMRPIDMGVFEWTGKLSAGGEFKFMNTNDGWRKHIVGDKADQTLQKDELYNLNFFATWTLDGKDDLKFRVADTGIYTVYVDLNAMMLKITDPVATAEWPAKFYITGSSVNDQVIEIPEYDGVEYKRVVSLSPGNVKVIDTPQRTDATRYFDPLFEDVDIQFGAGYYSPLYERNAQTSLGWNVSVRDDYALYFDKGAKTYSFKKYQPRRILYLVGGCCEKSWNYWDESNNKFYPDPENADIMVWEGELRIGWDTSNGNPPEPDKFKILTAPDWFKDTYHPYIADTSAVGTSQARITGGDDVKWTIDRDGYYRLVFDTRNETLTGTLIDPNQIGNPVSNPDTASVDTIAGDDYTGSVVYYNLQGEKVDGNWKGIVIAVHPSWTKKILNR